MIDLYTWTTPNGRKVSIMLEELALPYTAHSINITENKQFAPDFLKISPNNKIPAIVDRDTGISLMEFGRHFDLLGRKNGPAAPAQGRAPVPSSGVADVADGRAWPHARAGTSFFTLQQGCSALRRGAIFH